MAAFRLIQLGRSSGRSPGRGFRLLALLVILVMTLAACGSDGDGEESEPAAEETESEEMSEPDEEPEAEETEEAEEEVALDFYAGKDLEIILPYGPGGGADATTRLLAQYLEKHLEGVNSVQVINIEAGGANYVGNNQYDAMEPDGTLLGSSGSTHSAWVFGQEVVEYDMAGWTPLAGIGSGLVAFAANPPITEFEDVFDPPEPLYAALRVPTGGELTRALMNYLMDIEVEELWGYENRGATALSFEQGETNFSGETSPNYINNIMPMVEEGTVTPLWSAGLLGPDGSLERDAVFTDLPHFAEAYEAHYGVPAEEALGLGLEAFKALVSTSYNFSKGLWIHSDAPPEAIAAVQAAMREIVEDPDFIRDAEADLGGYPILLDEELQASFEANIVNIDREAIDWLADWLMERYDVALE